MIKKGWHLKPKISKKMRFCPFRPNKVEDEKHFLLECPTYKHIRSDLYNEAKNIFPAITNQPYNYRL